MIISANSEPHRRDFDFLLHNSVIELNRIAKTSASSVTTLAGNKLEPFIRDIISDLAIGTPFENSIELISGQRFPDIIAKKFYGIEVKSTTQNHWKTTGNSVLESTRVEGIERIFMLFGKLGKPVEFKCRPYEECLCEVVVTHSPRYLIDMNLSKGNTIFDKMTINYDELRQQPSPIKRVIEYYRSQLQPGQELWWLDPESKSSNVIIKLWSSLTSVQKRNIVGKALVYFPELLGAGKDKYGRLAMWLLTCESIVCPNLRDPFSAGGRVNLNIGGVNYPNLPQMFETLFKNLPIIFNILDETSVPELENYWSKRTTAKSKFDTWLGLVNQASNNIAPLKKMIADSLQSGFSGC